MTVATKVMVSTLGTSGAIVVGCYVGGVFTGEVEWHSLAEETSSSTPNPYAGKLGEKYGMYLTGVTKLENKEWWINSYQKYVDDKAVTGENARIFSDVFKKADGQQDDKITSAYSTSDTKALNKVCEDAYKKAITSEVDFSFTTIESNSDNKYKLAADILRYCSPLEKLPETIKSNDSKYNVEGRVGKQGSEKKLATTENNKEFWKLQQEWFKGLGKGDNQLDAYFGQFFEGANNNKTLKPGKHIQDICKDAYEKEAETGDTITTSKPKVDDVAKYCSFIKN